MLEVYGVVANVFYGVFSNALKVFLFVWWAVVPVGLFLIFLKIRLIYLRTKFTESIKWKLFEIKVPKDILKTPKAMEQVIAGLYASYSYVSSRMKIYLEGAVEPWFSLEVAGYSGGAYFYIYGPADKQNVIESAIYSQYPDAEIKEADDYTELAPAALPNEVFDLFAGELILARESFYPIKVYHYFESVVEEQRLDPIAMLIETMSKLKEGEKVWFQILISPTGSLTGNNWKKEGEEKIAEIIGKAKGKKPGLGDEFNAWFRNFFWAPVEVPSWPSEKKPEQFLKFLSPDEQDLVKEIANKISKLGFEAFIRFVYIDDKDRFTGDNVTAIMGALHQFSHYNSFKPLFLTRYDTLFSKIVPSYKKWRTNYRKKRIFDYYKKRRFGIYNKTRPEKFPVFSNEELATLYHLPVTMVEAPKLRRQEFKKGGPPPNLPIE